MAEEKDSGFRITDRRKFNPDGTPRDHADEPEAAASAAEQAYNQTRGPQSPHLPEASFLTLIDMFAAEAAMNLGMAQTPEGGRTPVDLEAARHWIDMLGMLEQKTSGNLSDEEAGVLENVLAYLRMQFVGASRKR